MQEVQTRPGIRGRELRNEEKLISRGPLVPYIAAWSAEQNRRARIVARRTGIGYADERPRDRDLHRVLWRRVPARPGRGRPLFGQVHSSRQRRAMLQLLCQVCGKAADRNENGVLWLLFDDRTDFPSLVDWPNHLTTVNPPVCLPCARTAVRVCPALRGSVPVAVRVGHSSVVGVYGALYQAADPRPVPVGDVTVAFDDPLVRWTQAAQLVREITHCTIVNLDDMRPR